MKLKVKKYKVFIVMLILLFGYGVYWYFYKTQFYLVGTDYSKTQWHTFYGKKTQSYLPGFQMTYSTDRNYGIKHKSEFEYYDEQNLVFYPIFSKFFLTLNNYTQEHPQNYMNMVLELSVIHWIMFQIITIIRRI